MSAIADVRLDPNNPIANVRGLALAVAELELMLREEVTAARRRGWSWQAIADALAVQARSGRSCGLGELFPGGASVTTVRRWFG